MSFDVFFTMEKRDNIHRQQLKCSQQWQFQVTKKLDKFEDDSKTIQVFLPTKEEEKDHDASENKSSREEAIQQLQSQIA